MARNLDLTLVLTIATASAREVNMAESRRYSTRAQRQPERTAERGIDDAETATERAAEQAEKTTERGIEEVEKATQQGAEVAEKATERSVEETERAIARRVEALRQQTERIEETGREAARQAIETSAAAFGGAARTSLALADATEEVVEVWAHYAEDVVRNTSQASQALARSCNIFDVMQVQITLVHDNTRSFLDQSTKLADTASRMMTRPFEVFREVRAGQAPR